MTDGRKPLLQRLAELQALLALDGQDEAAETVAEARREIERCEIERHKIRRLARLGDDRTPAND